MKPILLLLLLGVTVAAVAQVYKRTGPDGQVYFSDQPGEGAAEIEVKPAQTISMPPVTSQPATARQQTEASAKYTGLAVISPTSDQAIRANDGNVSVSLSLQPALMSGHALVLKIDGEDGEHIKTAGSLSVELTNLSRGLHTVEARVVDASNTVLIKSAPVRFNVLRVAAGGR